MEKKYCQFRRAHTGPVETDSVVAMCSSTSYLHVRQTQHNVVRKICTKLSALEREKKVTNVNHVTHVPFVFFYASRSRDYACGRLSDIARTDNRSE